MTHSGPVYRQLWTKVHYFSTRAQDRGSFSLQRRFLFDDILFHSGSAIKLCSCPKFGPNFDVLGPKVFLRGPKCLTKFNKFV